MKISTLVEQAPERDDLLPKVEAFMQFPTWAVVIGSAMWIGLAVAIWVWKGARIQ